MGHLDIEQSPGDPFLILLFGRIGPRHTDTRAQEHIVLKNTCL